MPGEMETDADAGTAAGARAASGTGAVAEAESTTGAFGVPFVSAAFPTRTSAVCFGGTAAAVSRATASAGRAATGVATANSPAENATRGATGTGSPKPTRAGGVSVSGFALTGPPPAWAASPEAAASTWLSDPTMSPEIRAAAGAGGGANCGGGAHNHGYADIGDVDGSVSDEDSDASIPTSLGSGPDSAPTAFAGVHRPRQPAKSGGIHGVAPEPSASGATAGRTAAAPRAAPRPRDGVVARGVEGGIMAEKDNDPSLQETPTARLGAERGA